MIRRLAIVIAMFTMGVQAALVSPACAQDNYPSRNITIVVGFAAGGTSDIIARLIGQKITESTGANVVIENIGGAASMTGDREGSHMPRRMATRSTCRARRRSPPIRTSIGIFATASTTSRPSPWSPGCRSAFDVRSRLPGTHRPGIRRARPQAAEPHHHCHPGARQRRRDRQRHGARHLWHQVQDVPYRGATPAVQDLIKGVVDAYFDAISSSIPLYQSGTVKMLAITGRTPLTRDAKCPNADRTRLQGLHARERDLTRRAQGHAARRRRQAQWADPRAMDDPKFRKSCWPKAIVPEPSTPEELRAVIVQDYEWNASMAKRFDIKPID